MLSLDKRLQVVYITLGVADVVLLVALVVGGGLVDDLDVPQLGGVQRDPHLTPYTGDLVTDEDVGAQVVVATLDADDLAHDVSTVHVGDFDDVPGSQTSLGVNKSLALAGGVQFL